MITKVYQIPELLKMLGKPKWMLPEMGDTLEDGVEACTHLDD